MPLDILDDVRVAAPCRMPWEDMAGDERTRFCGACGMNVYNLSGMTRADANALLAGREGRTCVRFFQRKDGTVLTADCPVGVRIRRRMRIAAGAVAGFLVTVTGIGALAAAAGRCHGTSEVGPIALVLSWFRDLNNPPQAIAGEMIFVPPSTPAPPPAGTP